MPADGRPGAGVTGRGGCVPARPRAADAHAGLCPAKLYEASHEDPYQPGSPGFATWPATKWPWFGELAERGYLVAAVHRGKNLLVTSDVARLLDPICRAEIERNRAADPGSARLLDHLATAGPSSADDLRTEFGLTP